jgi:maleylpyruvate isomerase
MNLRLYSYWRSSSSWRVRIGLHLKGLPFEYRAVDLVKDGGEQWGEAHRRRNPMAQVPVLEAEEGGRVLLLSQSVAILEWLDERFPDPPLLPSDPEGRARVRMLTEHVNSGIQPYQNSITLKWIRERLRGEAEGFAREFVGRGLEALERAVQQGRPPGSRFCHGERPTLADLYLVPQLFGARRWGVDVSRFPTLLAVERACGEIAAFRRSEPQAQPDAPPPERR